MLKYSGSIGVDEAGRGPALGPLFTAAVIWPEDENETDQQFVMDSKKLSPKNLKLAYAHVLKRAKVKLVGNASVTDVNTLGVLKANMQSMNENIRQVSESSGVTHALVDGNYFDNQNGQHISYETVVKGDGKYYCIAAASILAKYERDEHIRQLCADYPDLDHRYGILSNKGYLSKKHMEGLKEHGYCQFHRHTWKNFEGLRFCPVERRERKKVRIIKKKISSK